MIGCIPAEWRDTFLPIWYLPFIYRITGIEPGRGYGRNYHIVSDGLYLCVQIKTRVCAAINGSMGELPGFAAPCAVGRCGEPGLDERRMAGNAASSMPGAIQNTRNAGGPFRTCWLEISEPVSAY